MDSKQAKSIAMPNEAKHPLSCKSVSLSLNNKMLIRNIDLAFCATGISVLMGYNGAGKSLLLKLLHGMITPSAGHILWHTQAIKKTELHAQAMVFQQPVLLRRTVAQNIDFVLRTRHSNNKHLCADVLKRVGLYDKQHHSARKLSGGEQQRLALARALACEPDVLFLDEATASLDPASAASIEKVVTEVAASGTKVIATTHDVAQAKRLATEVIFLHDGELKERTPASTFFSEPKCNYARAFLDGKLVF